MEAVNEYREISKSLTAASLAAAMVAANAVPMLATEETPADSGKSSQSGQEEAGKNKTDRKTKSDRKKTDKTDRTSDKDKELDKDKADTDKTGTDNKGTEASQTGSQETADPGNASRSSPQTVTEAPAQTTLQAPAAADQTQTPQQPAPETAEPKEETASEPAPQAEESKPETQADTGSHVSVNGMMAAITGTVTGESTTGTVGMKTSADVTLNDCPDFVIEGGSYVTDMNGMELDRSAVFTVTNPQLKSSVYGSAVKGTGSHPLPLGRRYSRRQDPLHSQGVPVETLFMRGMTATAQGKSRPVPDTAERRDHPAVQG